MDKLWDRHLQASVGVEEAMYDTLKVGSFHPSARVFVADIWNHSDHSKDSDVVNAHVISHGYLFLWGLQTSPSTFRDKFTHARMSVCSFL